MGSAPKVPKPQDPLALAGGQSSQLLSYYGSEVPKFMELQSRLGPGLMAQMLGQSSQFLKGVEGQPGFNKLQKSGSYPRLDGCDLARASGSGQGISAGS
jgi:hypothetical protein